MAAMNSNDSSQKEDIIKKCVLISSGPPAVYQLRPEKTKIGTLTRMTVGEKSPNHPNKTILLVGETGTGKSTLINALFNYIRGVTWEEETWFQILEEERNENQTESQTSDVIVYEIFGFEDKILPYSLTIIDTPGYGNTRGIEHDGKISKKLFDLFGSKEGVHEVHAVGLVMKATDNRMNDRPIYVFDSVMSLFGRDLENKIVALITHSNGRRPKSAFEALEAAKIKCAKNKKNQPVHFLFDNCQHENRTEEKDYLQHAHTLSERGIREFTDFLKESGPQKLEITVEVLNERIRLADCIKDLHDRTEEAQLKEEEIRENKEALRKHEEEMKENEEFIEEAVDVIKEKEQNSTWFGFSFKDNQTVCCKVCEENCFKTTKKPEHCEVIKDGQCTACKCHVSAHVKENWRYVTKTRKVQKTNEEMKKKYEKNKSESEIKLSLLENLDKEMNQLTAEKSQFLDESYQHVIKLEQIALKADSASTIVHLDFLIEKMKEKGDTEKVQELEEMRSKEGEGTRAALRFKQQLRK